MQIVYRDMVIWRRGCRLACGILSVGLKAKSSACGVPLPAPTKYCRRAASTDTDDEHTGGHRIERAAMAHLEALLPAEAMSLPFHVLLQCVMRTFPTTSGNWSNPVACAQAHRPAAVWWAPTLRQWRGPQSTSRHSRLVATGTPGERRADIDEIIITRAGIKMRVHEPRSLCSCQCLLCVNSSMI